MANNVDNNEKLWPDSVVKAFIDIMVEEVTQGNMPNGVFHSRIWTLMTEKLNSKTSRLYTAKQLKAKMHRLRGLYRVFDDLVKNSGFGWDAETNTVTASEEVWKDYIRVHDKAAQFQKKGLDHYKLLGIIFNRSTATGVLHHSATQDPPNTDEENELENQYLTSGGRVDIESSNEDVEEIERVTRSGKRKVQVKERKFKKESKRAVQMGDALAAWADASKAKAERYTGGRSMEASSHVTEDRSITKCIHVLEEIEGISDDIYVKAMEKFKEAEYRELFLASSLNRKLAWLNRI